MEKRAKVMLCLVCATAFTLAISTTSRAQNLLADPGAEQELTAPNPNPTGVAGWANFGGTAFLTTPNAHSGTNVIETPGGAGNYSVPGSYQDFAASALQTWTLSGWVYSVNQIATNSNDFAILQLSFFTGAPPSNYASGTQVGPTVGIDIGSPAGSGTLNINQGVWTFFSVSAIASNAGINHVNSVGAYLLNINADANADFYFDDLSLTVVPEPSSIMLALTGLCGLAVFAKKRRV